jgi:diacylglycerol kinase (ATP)
VGVVANRNAGMGRGLRLVAQLVNALGQFELGAQVAWCPEERSALVHRSNNSNCRCLVAIGGDGTFSALLNERPSVPLSALPAGTENLVARHFELDRDPYLLAQTIATSHPALVDVGQVRERLFLLMVSFGFDGDVVTAHHESRLSRGGSVCPTHRLAYVVPVLRSSLIYRFPEITVRIGDRGAEEELVGTSVFVFNAPRYALGLPFAPTAADNDGWLDLLVFCKAGAFQALHYLWEVFRGTHLRDPSVCHRRVKEVEVTGKSPIPVQIDGDPGGVVLPDHSGQAGTKWFVRAVPSAVEVISGSARRACTWPG